MRKLYILCFCLSISIGFAQTNLNKANKLFKEYYYADAAKMYEKYLTKENAPSTDVLKNIGDSYYFTDDMRNASKWYEKLYFLQGSTIDEIHFIRLIESLKAILDYDRADQIAKEYLLKKGNQNRMTAFANQKKQMDSLSKVTPQYTITNLPSNTSKADFGTSFFGNKIVYSSSKDTSKVGQKLYNRNKEPYLSMYVSERNNENGSLYNEQIFLPNIQTKYHESTVAISKDLSKVYYTTNILKNKKLLNHSDGTNNFKIVRASMDGMNAKNTEDIFFDSTEYSVGHPALSDDGKLLFFSSDMPGGFGGADIYVSAISENGTIGPPKNLGAAINSAGNDMFPSFTNGVLYFASEGHFGWGGLDIYESKLKQNMTFSEPRNLGAPINSNRDDFAYILDSSDTFGYFSSNRSGGKGGDDIYYFTKTKAPCEQLISGKIQNPKSNLPITEATIKAYNALGDLVAEGRSNADGTYKIKVPCAMKLTINATKENHSKEEKNVLTTAVNAEETKNINFNLVAYEDLVIVDGEKEKIDINTIFFDYDNAQITPQAALELDKVVFTLKNFPKLKIKIESHTDSRGKDAYNLKLSDKRAKATQTYILSKDIDASRIESAMGYGETQLLNKCSNGVKCSDEQHFVNRRSDFIVIEK